jgi:hypothetical protein
LRCQKRWLHPSPSRQGAHVILVREGKTP